MTPRRSQPVHSNADVTFWYHVDDDSAVIIMLATRDHQMKLETHVP
jgi:hypothetical protein